MVFFRSGLFRVFFRSFSIRLVGQGGYPGFLKCYTHDPPHPARIVRFCTRIRNFKPKIWLSWGGADESSSASLCRFYPLLEIVI
jgi:hypothetical protein